MQTVRLIPDQLKMSQKLNMAIFHIIDWSWKTQTTKYGEQWISAVVVMKRKITSEMMTTYFPSLLLTAITFATTFFKPWFFEAALSVNLTTMLVMTTIFISKMEGLPPTSDIKMIDIWLVLCQMVPFAEVVLLTAMEYHREDKKKGRKAKKKRKDQDDKDVYVVFPKVTAATQTNDKEDMGISIESQWRRRIREKSWFPSLKTIGLLNFMLILQY